ncbi:MAG: MBL fold metallo-hydrolase [Promethearchaeota archaeon]
MLKIIVLGSGNAFNEGERMYPGFLVQTDRSKFLIDCGPTAVFQLRKLGIDFQSLDGLIITHFHGDHIAGIPFLFLDFHYQSRRARQFTCVGPMGLDITIERLYKACYEKTATEPRTYPLKHMPIKPKETVSEFGVQIQAFPMLHSPESLGYRITHPSAAIAVTGDTSWNNEIVKMANGVDLLIIEGNFWDRDAGGHMSYQVLEKHLSEINARKIVLTHPSRDVLGREKELRIPLLHDSQEIDLDKNSIRISKGRSN